jgi:hypothetical protein
MKSKQKQSKYRRPYKYDPQTGPGKRAEVVGLRLANWNKSKIAKHVGLNRQTVSRILSQSEVETLMDTYRNQVLQIIPDALLGLHVLVHELDRTAIIETLYGARVFTDKKEIDVKRRPDERTYTFPMVAFFGKYNRWPSLEEAKKFEETLNIEPLVKESAQRTQEIRGM